MVSFWPICGVLLPYLLIKWGLRPHTLSYFLYGQKVTKKPHREGTLSMGSRPEVTPPPHHTKGGKAPFGIPRIDETYPKLFWILPRVRYKKNVSISTNRNIHLFNRPAGEVSTIDPL